MNSLEIKTVENKLEQGAEKADSIDSKTQDIVNWLENADDKAKEDFNKLLEKTLPKKMEEAGLNEITLTQIEKSEGTEVETEALNENQISNSQSWDKVLEKEQERINQANASDKTKSFEEGKK